MTKTIHNNIRTDKVAKISFLSSFLQAERSASALRTFASLLQLLRQHDRTWWNGSWGINPESHLKVEQKSEGNLVKSNDQENCLWNRVSAVKSVSRNEVCKIGIEHYGFLFPCRCGSRIWSRGGPQLLRPKVADIAKRAFCGRGPGPA